jgi:hypothetical protein
MPSKAPTCFDSVLGPSQMIGENRAELDLQIDDDGSRRRRTDHLDEAWQQLAERIPGLILQIQAMERDESGARLGVGIRGALEPRERFAGLSQLIFVNRRDLFTDLALAAGVGLGFLAAGEELDELGPAGIVAQQLGGLVARTCTRIELGRAIERAHRLFSIAEAIA